MILSLTPESFHDDEIGVGVEDSRTRLKGLREDKRFGEDKMRVCHRVELVESWLLRDRTIDEDGVQDGSRPTLTGVVYGPGVHFVKVAGRRGYERGEG